jgi:hypothetical protein
MFTPDGYERPPTPGVPGAAELAGAPRRRRMSPEFPGPFRSDSLSNHRMHDILLACGPPCRARSLTLSLRGTTVPRRRTHRPSHRGLTDVTRSGHRVRLPVGIRPTAMTRPANVPPWLTTGLESRGAGLPPLERAVRALLQALQLAEAAGQRPRPWAGPCWRRLSGVLAGDRWGDWAWPTWRWWVAARLGACWRRG